jgi:hypothetical protein
MQRPCLIPTCSWHDRMQKAAGAHEYGAIEPSCVCAPLRCQRCPSVAHTSAGGQRPGASVALVCLKKRHFAYLRTEHHARVTLNGQGRAPLTGGRPHTSHLSNRVPPPDRSCSHVTSHRSFCMHTCLQSNRRHVCAPSRGQTSSLPACSPLSCTCPLVIRRAILQRVVSALPSTQPLRGC